MEMKALGAGCWVKGRLRQSGTRFARYLNPGLSHPNELRSLGTPVTPWALAPGAKTLALRYPPLGREITRASGEVNFPTLNANRRR